MLKVVQIISSASIGGGEQYLLTLIRYLHGRDFSFHIIVPEAGLFCRELEKQGVSYTVVPMPHLFRPLAVSQIQRALRQQGAQIVNCHGARANWYGRPAGRWAGVGTILSTVHNSLLDYPYPMWRRRFYIALENLSSRWVDRWIAVSEDIRRDLIREYGLPEEKVAVIPNGVDVDCLQARKSRRQVRKELGLEPETILLMAAARMTRQKGHTYLLQALSRLPEQTPPVVCLVAGDGPLRADLEKESRRLKLDSKVRFLGFRQDVPDLIHAADIYVLPSLSEGLPFALLEAMALGCPVIAGDVSGIPEVIDHNVNGILVPPADSGALAGAIERLAADRAERLQLGEKGKQTVLENFTARQMIAKVRDLYLSHARTAGVERK